MGDEPRELIDIRIFFIAILLVILIIATGLFLYGLFGSLNFFLEK